MKAVRIGIKRYLDILSSHVSFQFAPYSFFTQNLEVAMLTKSPTTLHSVWAFGQSRPNVLPVCLQGRGLPQWTPWLLCRMKRGSPSPNVPEWIWELELTFPPHRPHFVCGGSRDKFFVLVSLGDANVMITIIITSTKASVTTWIGTFCGGPTFLFGWTPFSSASFLFLAFSPPSPLSPDALNWN